jgi:hypothetical protein
MSLTTIVLASTAYWIGRLFGTILLILMISAVLRHHLGPK